MKTSDFDYVLPDELIAQSPSPLRDQCRMLVLDRKTESLQDRIFCDVIDYLSPGDLLVANETRVMPARLIGKKRNSGGVAEVFLLRPCIENVVNSSSATWEVLVRPGKRLKPGSIVDFEDDFKNVILSAEIVDWACESGEANRGMRIAKMTTSLPSLDDAFHDIGHAPLPPYIKDYCGDEEMYQTVYSKSEKSAAAPTAGLHFTDELIEKCKNKGVGWATVDLQVGLDTFRTVDEENAEDHKMHTEVYSVSNETAKAVSETKKRRGRVFAVGTTSVRTLESAAKSDGLGEVRACENEKTSLYLMPGAKFHVVDGMITNFHVPKSTLMMLVSAFATREMIMKAYKHAVDEKYRFLSFGDAMLIL